MLDPWTHPRRYMHRARAARAKLIFALVLAFPCCCGMAIMHGRPQPGGAMVPVTAAGLPSQPITPWPVVSKVPKGAGELAPIPPAAGHRAAHHGSPDAGAEYPPRGRDHDHTP